MLNKMVAELFVWLKPEAHGNMPVTDTLWYLHQSTSQQINGIFALSFCVHSLVLLLSTKQDT